MKRLLLAFVLALAGVGFAAAAEFRGGDIAVERPWARASAGRSATGVVYLRMSNRGSDPEQLIAIATPAAADASLHETVREDGTMSMRELESVVLPAGGSVSLQPGGMHIMLMRLKSPLLEGESFPMTLTFEGAGRIDVRVEVRGVGAMEW